MQTICSKVGFPEPHLILIIEPDTDELQQCLILVEQQVMLEIEEKNIPMAITTLIGAYYTFYINYPKSHPAAGFLLFTQEILMGKQELQLKKTTKYNSFIDSIL